MKLSEWVEFHPIKSMPASTHQNFDGWFADKFKVPFIKKHKLVDEETLLGIEVEVENIKPTSVGTSAIGDYWIQTEDGSLRNNGKEFVTHPLEAKYTEFALRTLFIRLDKGYEFSKRCSIHVHLNARDFTLEQIKTLMLLYMVFEDSLFKFVGEDRDKNIHCVPICETPFMDSMYFMFKTWEALHHAGWMKYSAVNLCPLTVANRGTIEFRQMHGTDDVDKLMIWINFILSLKVAAFKIPYADLEKRVSLLNTNSQYRQFCNEIFGDMLASRLADGLPYGVFDAGMEEGVSNMKMYFSANDFKKELINTIGKSKSAKVTTYDSWDSMINQQVQFTNPSLQGLSAALHPGNVTLSNFIQVHQPPGTAQGDYPKWGLSRAAMQSVCSQSAVPVPHPSGIITQNNPFTIGTPQHKAWKLYSQNSQNYIGVTLDMLYPPMPQPVAVEDSESEF